MVSELVIGIVAVSLVCVIASALLTRKVFGNSDDSSSGSSRRRKRSKGARREE